MSAETCWTLIRAVNRGDPAARDDFAQRYAPTVHVYLAARWRKTALAPEAEDAKQEVLVRCFSESGPLDRLHPDAGGFRGFLLGVCRNVAREFEKDRGRRAGQGGEFLEELPAQESRLSQVFDREFARQVMREARSRFKDQSLEGGSESSQRFELLTLRFEENLPIRSIAERWGRDPARVHKEYARARREFREVLLGVVAEQNPGRSAAAIEEAASQLVSLLG